MKREQPTELVALPVSKPALTEVEQAAIEAVKAYYADETEDVEGNADAMHALRDALRKLGAL